MNVVMELNSKQKASQVGGTTQEADPLRVTAQDVALQPSTVYHAHRGRVRDDLPFMPSGSSKGRHLRKTEDPALEMHSVRKEIFTTAREAVRR
jgi:hypothetical protein